jgi:hypothetical protein
MTLNMTSWDRNLMGELKDILQAHRAISREIEVGRLIETLLTIAVDLVSAERGLLFLARGSALEVEAEAIARDGSVRLAFPHASPASPEFPQTVLRTRPSWFVETIETNKRGAFAFADCP